MSPTKKITTVTGAEIEAGKVYKFGGRWKRVIRFLDNEWQGSSQYKTVVVADHGKDPRLANLTSMPGRRNTYGQHRMIWAGDEYLTREQPPVEWEWVTRDIQRQKDSAAGIVTPCTVCATQARAGKAFFADRGLDWPTVIVARRLVHKVCAGDAEWLEQSIGDLLIDGDGVGRWVTNNSVIPDDAASLIVAFGLAPGLNVEATRAARVTDTREAIERYRASQPAEASAEEIAEMRAAFGPGQVIVDVITGRRTQL
jgi:hypothetical protein